MSIPGTHDTLTDTSSPGLFDAINYCSKLVWCQCHSKTLKSQLEMGIRHIDVRLKCEVDKFWMYHGDISIGITFGDVLRNFETILERESERNCNHAISARGQTPRRLQERFSYAV